MVDQAASCRSSKPEAGTVDSGIAELTWSAILYACFAPMCARPLIRFYARKHVGALPDYPEFHASSGDASSPPIRHIHPHVQFQ